MCFSKNDIYSISRQIEARGQECAVIYGSLPPGEGMNFHFLIYLFLYSPCKVLCITGTKLSQAKKFNDPDDSCKILVATDAIGMGLNLYVSLFL